MTLSFPSFTAFPVEAGVTTRDLPLFLSGVSDLEDATRAERLRRYLSPSRYWAYPEQIHGPHVRFLSEETLREGASFRKIAGTDGLFTGTPQTTLSILTADCLPVFFLVPDPLTVGLAHAGWRGSSGGIAGAAVDRLRRQTRQSPEQFQIAFGPAIRACCYRVGEEFKPLFRETIRARQGAWYLDLVEENRRQLEKAGVRGEKIRDEVLCTACHPELFFSYRRDKSNAGRMVSWIRIRDVLP